METKIGAAILAGAFLFASALPVVAGGRAGDGGSGGNPDADQGSDPDAAEAARRVLPRHGEGRYFRRGE
jgi:hypothetical protein